VLGSAEAIKKDDAPRKPFENLLGEFAMDSQRPRSSWVKESSGTRQPIDYGMGSELFFYLLNGINSHQ